MDKKKFHDIIKDIKKRDMILVDNFDMRRELSDVFESNNFIQDFDVKIPYITIKTKLPKDFLIDFLGINDNIIDTDFACLDYNNYLINCDNFEEKEEEGICEVVDIANEEMKRIDSSEIDSQFKEVFTSESTKHLIDLVYSEQQTLKDLKFYLETINNKDIVDLRVVDKSLYVVTKKNITESDLSKIMELEERCFEKVPIVGKYNFYLIDTRRWSSPMEKKPSYDSEDFVEELQNIGRKSYDNLTSTSKLQDMVYSAFFENWTNYSPEDIDVAVEIEDEVVAIAISQFIPDAKEIISDILDINPDLFIEVSTPIGTVILIDTRRWVLEPYFGDEEWYQ